MKNKVIALKKTYVYKNNSIYISYLFNALIEKTLNFIKNGSNRFCIMFISKQWSFVCEGSL